MSLQTALGKRRTHRVSESTVSFGVTEPLDMAEALYRSPWVGPSCVVQGRQTHRRTPRQAKNK